MTRPTDDKKNTASPQSAASETANAGLARRTVLKGAAWSVPTVALAVAAPAATASTNGAITFAKPSYQVGQGGTIAIIAGTVTITTGTLPTSVTIAYPGGFTGPTSASVASNGSFSITGVVAGNDPVTGNLTVSAPGINPGMVSLQILVNPVPAAGDGIVWGENLDNTLFRSGGGNLKYAVTPDFLTASASLGAGQTLALAGGYRGANSYLLKSDGSLWSHGDGSNATAPGTTSVNAAPFSFSGLQPGEALVDVVGFTGGGYALTTAGRVFSWGFNTGSGSLGNGTTGPDTNVPRRVTFPDGTFIRQLSASYTGGLALDAEGQIWAWGINDQNDTGTASQGTVSTPRRVVFADGSPVSGATQVRGRYKGGLALVGDRVLSWGTNSGGQLGNGSTSGTRGYADWVQTGPGAPLTGIVKLAGFYHEAYHAVALASSGSVYSWGYGSYFVHTPSTEASRPYAQPYGGSLPTGTIRDVCVSYYGTHVLLADGTVWNWGYGAYGQGGNGTLTSPLKTPVRAMIDANTPVIASGFFASSHGGVIARK